ncbi:MAG: nucleotidyltransferase substrate binding protein [Gammaproteobacteria bacterium]|nr:nucleotidyltransferase substrate binding protein [Gammaproteobacteria bacterium]
MIINIEPLKKAFVSLVKAVDRSSAVPDDLELRDSCIQRFEYTYELCIKMTKRYLEQELPLPQEIDRMNYRDLLRVAYENGLVNEVEAWFKYREARNQTSHAYDEIKAQYVYQTLPSFIVSADFLLKQLENRLGSS